MGYGSAMGGGRNEGAGSKMDKDKSDRGGNNKGGKQGDNGLGGSGKKQDEGILPSLGKGLKGLLGGAEVVQAKEAQPAMNMDNSFLAELGRGLTKVVNRTYDAEDRRGLGGTKKAGNATTADSMIATGQINVPSIGPNGMAQGNYNSQQDAYTDFGRAVGAYATRGLAGKIGDAIAGPFYDEQEPISQNPRTFASGTFHSSTNPLGAAAAIAGMATGIPGLGTAGSIIGDAVGIPHVSHGGYSQPDTGIYSDNSSSFGLDFGGLQGNPNGPGMPGNGEMYRAKDKGQANRAISAGSTNGNYDPNSGDPGSTGAGLLDPEAEYSGIRMKDRRKPYLSASDYLGI